VPVEVAAIAARAGSSPGGCWVSPRRRAGARPCRGLSSQAGLPGALDLRHRPAREARHDAVHCLLVHEPTFARLLAVARRPSSPLPWLLRNAWDGQPLDPIRHPSVRHHVGLVAHVTLEQLRMLMA
jgi:hypothetical protein